MSRSRIAVLVLIAALASASAARARTSVAAFGDSLTANDPWVSALGDVYDVRDLGVPGERTAEGLVRLEAWIAEEGGTTDYVTLLEGTNDFFAADRSEDDTFANLRRMAAAVEAAGMVPVLIAPPPVLAFRREAEDERARRLAVRLGAAAAASGQRFVDLYALFRAQSDVAALYTPEGIHASTLGNALIERAVRQALDNCPGADNPDQRDTDSDGIGDACQCGDVSGDGTVSLGDAGLLARSLASLRAAALPRPDLCDVNGSRGCSLADAARIVRALLSPGRPARLLRCPAPIGSADAPPSR